MNWAVLNIFPPPLHGDGVAFTVLCCWAFNFIHLLHFETPGFTFKRKIIPDTSRMHITQLLVTTWDSPANLFHCGCHSPGCEGFIFKAIPSATKACLILKIFDFYFLRYIGFGSDHFFALALIHPGKPLFEMCCFHMGFACKGGGDVKACQDGLRHFFPHVCPWV